MYIYMKYIIYSQPFLNQHTKQYQNILVVNEITPGPLSQRIVRINPPKLSSFNYLSSKCIYAIRNSENCDYMTVNDFPEFSLYLVSNGYIIDYDMTKLLQNTITENRVMCVFSGEQQ